MPNGRHESSRHCRLGRALCSGLLTPGTFTPEFKREAAGLVLDQGYSLTEAARSLDLVESALRRSVNQLQSERGGATPASKALSPEQQKIQELALDMA